MSESRQIDLLDGDWYADGPYADYSWMRENRPLYWDSVNELWGVSRHADIVEIEKRKDIFINSDQAKGGYRPNIPADPAIIGLDDPIHAARRNLVSRRFTPRAVLEWEPVIRAKISSLLDGVAANGGSTEVIADLAAPLPAMMIGLLSASRKTAGRTCSDGRNPPSHSGVDRAISTMPASWPRPSSS